MNPRLDCSQSLRQRRRFSVGRDHEKGSQPLQKHRDHRRLYLVGQIIEGLDLFENWIELRRRNEIRRPFACKFARVELMIGTRRRTS